MNTYFPPTSGIVFAQGHTLYFERNMIQKMKAVVSCAEPGGMTGDANKKRISTLW